MNTKSAVYLTTPIFYPTAEPHIGTAYTMIAADVLARWYSRSGKEVFFLTGTDEHGKKLEEAAKRAGKLPKQFVDSLVPTFKDAWRELDITYSRFIRTTDADHERTVRTALETAYQRGDIYKGNYEGYYCTGCEAYYTETDAADKRCPIHGMPLEILREESYFFALSKYQDKLLELYKKNPEFISPENRQQEIINRVREGLQDLSISRTSFAWGIPLPFDKEHVTFVWFDALLNYLSGVGYPEDMRMFRKLWPADVHIIGKDILWFHVVIWPAILMSLGVDQPKKVFAHGWLTVEGQKMSKSIGNVITAKDLVARFGTDPARYYLLQSIPFGQDGDFSEAQLVSTVNANLADTYGNLLSRVVTLVEKNFNSRWPAAGELTEHEHDIESAANALEKQVDDALAKLQFSLALEAIFGFIRTVNKYMTDTTPWKVKDTPRLGTILYTVLEGLRVATCVLAPFIPSTAEKAAAQLGQPLSIEHAHFDRRTTGAVKKGEVLQKKLEVKKQESPFAALGLRVAHVVSAGTHPDAGKLLVLKISLGNEERTLCAGLKAHYTPGQLVGKHIVIVANLKPAKLRGIVSQGMLLAAEKDGVVKVIEAPQAEPGSPVTIPGVKPNPQQITLDDFAKVKLTTKLKKVVFEGQQLVTPTGEVGCDIGDDATIR